MFTDTLVFIQESDRFRNSLNTDGLTQDWFIGQMILSARK